MRILADVVREFEGDLAVGLTADGGRIAAGKGGVMLGRCLDGGVG